jgi:predicted thioredoxin/glutaredoxin
VRLVLVTRQGCHLCDQALALLRSLGHEPELADVDADDRLHDLYDWRVPVVLVDGRVVAEGKIDAERLRKAISGLSSRGSDG